MREGWKYVSILDVCKVYQPQTIATSKLIEGAQYDVFGANGCIGKYNQYNHEEDEVLLTCRGATCGNINRSTPKSWINGNAMVVHPIGNDLIKDFLVYVLKSVDFSKVITGAAQPQITRTSLSSVTLSIPPLSEQERIVSLLDLEFAKIDAIKANAEKQLQDAKDLFQSALKDLLTPKEGWKIRKFGDVCEYYKEQGKWVNINYIGLENIDAHTGKLIDYKSSNEVESSTFKFNKGDVLYGRLRPYLQKVIIAPFDGCCSTEIFPIKSNVVNNVYLKFWLLSDAVTDIMNESCSGCRMPRANMNSFKEEYIQYPSEQEQIIIANKLVDLQNMIGEIQFNYEQTITLCNDLKQSILKDIFG
ncbi:MAG: restriction endonuclease subunit S [Paludibacteraceae bacterium]|nr:restriction endonuclease subunit S [Paludibacteraceae bacterium]